MVRILKELSLSEISNIFRKELPIYGDFLRYFIINLGELPYEYSTPLLVIGEFYEKLKDILKGMLIAYIELGLLRSGYIDIGLLEIYIEEQDWVETFDDLKDVEYKDIEKLVIDVIDQDILTGELVPQIEGSVYDFINLGNLNECIRVLILTEFPRKLFSENTFYITEDYSEDLIDGWIKELNKPLTIFGEQLKCRVSKFIVVDPLLYKLSKEAINNLKKWIKEKTGNDIVYHVEDFLNQFLPDRQLFDEEWNQKRYEVIKNLKEEYPFLSIHDEIWRIRIAEKDLKGAITYFLARGSELTESDSRTIIFQACRAIEAVLGVMYHLYKKEESTNKTFGELLSKLRRDIIEEYGEDIYRDLEFIKEWRNTIAHPYPVSLSREDVIKVLKKAELFLELFKSKAKVLS